MSNAKSQKTILVVVGLVAVLLIAGAFFLLSKSSSSGGSEAAQTAASVLPENVAGLAWSLTIDDALELAAKMKLDKAALDSLGADYSKVVARLGFDLLDASALKELGIDTSGAPAVGLAPAHESEGLVLLYIPIVAGKSGIEVFTTLTAKVGDKAPVVDVEEKDGTTLGWVYRKRVDSGALYEAACTRAIELIRESGEVPADAFDSGMADDIMRECTKDLNGKDREQATAMANCMLTIKDFKAIDSCMDAKAGDAAVSDVGVEKTLRGALVDVDGGLLMVIPVDYSHRHKEEIEGELRGFVAKVTDKSVKRLSEVDGFKESIAGSDGALLGCYVNPAPVREMMAGERDLAPVAAALTEIAGFGAYVKEVDNALVAAAQTVSTAKEPKQFLRKRDTTVLNTIPGEPLIGFHVAMDAELIMREVERALSLEDRAWDDYQDGKQEIQSAVGLPGVELHQVWDGEFAIFVGDLAPNPEFVVRTITAFVGVKDVEKVKTALGAAATLSRGKLIPEKVGEAQAWRFTEDGLTMGVMLHNNRLWFAGDWSVLAKIEKGESGDLLTGERGSKIAAIMGEDQSLAAFADLKRPIALARTAMRGGDKQMMEMIGPALDKLDYVSYSGNQDGRVSGAQVAVHLTEGSFTELAADAFAAQFLVAADKYSRRAKTTEAIDMLDKIYKGAADYYSTPRVAQYTGEKLPCQFPESVSSTPGHNCCASQGGPDANDDGKCDVEPGAWASDTWSALKFEIMDPHYCVYSFDNNGKTGADAEFTATAHCDLDCDGVRSTFQRYGKGDPHAYGGECYITSGAGLFIKDELE